MHLGNSINFRAGLSKEITNKLWVGIAAGGGYAWTYGNDWSLYGDLGMLYRPGDLGFLKDFRFALSVQNLGKMYDKVTRAGISKDAENTAYPTLATVRTGVAATLLETEIAKIGFGIDVATPCFQNIIASAKFNLMETINGKNSFIPSVAFLFKFSFDVKNNSYLESNGWSQSEMTVSAGYKNLYSTVHAISAGVDIDLGMADNEAPKIVVWDNE